MINLASVIHSPMLSQDILVKRTSGVWVNGDFIKNEEPETLQVHCIITVASPRDLNMIPEADRQSGAIKVLTTERLQVTGEDEGQANFSDIILWRGEEYKVYSVSPDADYGFYRSIAMRMLRGTS